MSYAEAIQGCKNLIKCAGLQQHERALILVNESTRKMGELLLSQFESDNLPQLQVIPDLAIHGEEPPESVLNAMKQHDVIFGMTKMSLAHTKSRVEAGLCGSRYLSLADYDMDVLSSPALAVDFSCLENISNEIAKQLSRANTVQITTALGTNVLFNIEHRTGNAAPGTCFNKGGLASPPDAEANIAPNEQFGSGRIVIDGSIPCAEIGLLKDSVVLDILDGKIINIEGNAEAASLKKLFERFSDQNVRQIAEVGIGLNPLAELKGSMLEDEGVFGTVHFGFGANVALGGKTSVPFHLDFILKHATIKLDDRTIMRDGVLDDTLAVLYPFELVGSEYA